MPSAPRDKEKPLRQPLHIRDITANDFKDFLNNRVRIELSLFIHQCRTVLIDIDIWQGHGSDFHASIQTPCIGQCVEAEGAKTTN